MSHGNGTATSWIIGTLTVISLGACGTWAIASAARDDSQDITLSTTVQRVTTLEANYETILETARRMEMKMDRLSEQVKWRK